MHASKSKHCDRKLTNRVGTAAKTRLVNATEVCRNNNQNIFYELVQSNFTQCKGEIQGTWIKDNDQQAPCSDKHLTKRS